MTEPPPLPETDDPHELLGVPEDADERSVRKAYARLIKVYRPDRSPDEFQRVHAAYETLTGVRDAEPDEGRIVVEVAAPREDEEPRGPGVEPGDEVDRVSRQILEAALADDEEAATAIAVDLEGDRGWWDAAFEDPDVANATWRLLAALSWLTDVDALHTRLKTVPWRWKQSTDADVAEIDLAWARAVRRGAGEPPRQLSQLIVASWLGTAEQKCAAARSLLEGLRADPEGYREVFSAAFEPQPKLAHQVQARLSGWVADVRNVGPVSVERARKLRELIVVPLPRRTKLAVAAMVWSVVALSTASLAFASWKLGLGVGIGTLLVIAVGGTAALRGSYERTRAAITRGLVTEGISTLLLDHHIKTTLHGFSFFVLFHRQTILERDPSLRALSVTAAWAATIAEAG